MDPDRRRDVLANIAAALLIVGAAAACLAVSIGGEKAYRSAFQLGLPPIVVALVAGYFAWPRPRAKLVVSQAALIFAAAVGVVGYEYFVPQVYGVPDTENLPTEFRRLVPLHARLTKAKPGEWLDDNIELGQSYGQYIEGERIRSDAARRTIYVQPLGDFTSHERKIVNLTAEFLGLFYQLPVRVRDDLPLSIVPDSARRDPPKDGRVLLYSYPVLREVLKPRLPDDAVAMIALTTVGIRKSEQGAGLFGSASFVDRVGLWTMGGLGDPTAGDREFVDTLRRVLHVAVHETGHMFSIEHCVYYRCCMNGCSGRREMDTQPLWFCPQCQAKVAYATGGDPAKQLTEIITFAERHGLEPEAAFWRRSLAAIKTP